MVFKCLGKEFCTILLGEVVMLTKKEQQLKNDLSKVYAKLQCDLFKFNNSNTEQSYSTAIEFVQNQLQYLIQKETSN